MRDKRMSLDDVVGELRSGMTIGLGGWGSRRKPMALVRAILRSDVKDLTVVTYGGPDLGLLCSAGKVKKAYYGFVSLDSAPFYDPWFAKVRTGGEIVANTFSTTAQNATLVVNNSGNDRFDGDMKNGTGNLVLTKSGTGTLTLGGANSYTGATTVNAGLLNIDGSLTASNVTVGANGALGGNGGVISQSVTISNGGAMSFTLESPLQTNLTVGSLSLGSDIDLQLALAVAVNAGQSFTILDIGGSHTGTFATVNGQAFGADNAFSLQYGSQWYDFELSYGPNAVVLNVVPEPRAVLLVALAGGCLLLGRKGWKARLG